MDLIGNPLSLVVTSWSAVNSLIREPFIQLSSPTDFAAKLFTALDKSTKLILAGGAMSVSELADSMGRNLNRLSFDSDHVTNVDKYHGRPPPSLANGLQRGLATLGINLLGAVGGLAEQPLLAVSRGLDEGSDLPEFGAGVVAGVSKGIVGIVTKPLAGVAGFVAMTGQGLASSLGAPGDAKQQPVWIFLGQPPFFSGLSKYNSLWLSPPSILTTLACRSANLLLARDMIYVYSEAEGILQQAYALDDIVLESRDNCISVYQVLQLPVPENEGPFRCEREAHRRLVAFLDYTSGYGTDPTHAELSAPEQAPAQLQTVAAEVSSQPDAEDSSRRHQDVQKTDLSTSWPPTREHLVWRGEPLDPAHAENFIATVRYLSRRNKDLVY